MAEEFKAGDYVGLYIDDKLIYTGVLKDQGDAERAKGIPVIASKKYFPA